jgi:hypothetical protein
MLEKFTPEEIMQIKKELKLLGNENSTTKGVVLSQFRNDIREMFPETKSECDVNYYTSEQHEIMTALIVLCDFATKNYIAEGTHKIKRDKHIPFKIQSKYKSVMSELLETLRKCKEK